MTNFSPNEHYRYSLKEGMSGFDVWALQIALNAAPLNPHLVLDGDFGPKTAGAVKTIQTNLHVTVDGIAGPQTQSTLCARECESIHGLVPEGLIKGICFGESGGIIPATSGLYASGSRDYGPLQDNMTNPTQGQLENAFNPKYEVLKVAHELNNSYTKFIGKPGAKTPEEAWKLAVLNYNWPAAAEQIAKGNGNMWQYESEGKRYHMYDPAPWVKNIGVPGVTTGLQWAEFYVQSKIVYVTSWSVPS